MPELDALDREVRAANFIAQDAPARPIEDLLVRLEDERPLRNRIPRRAPALAVALVLAASGSAAATVAVLDRTGPSTGLAAAARPDSAAGTRLTGLFNPSYGSRLTGERRAFPELGDTAPISGITVHHGDFDVDVAQDGTKVCFGARLPAQPLSSGACTNLPIPYDALPLAAGGTVRPTRRIYVSIAPDGVRDLTVTTRDGRNRTEPFVDNVAAVAFDGGDAEMTNYAWTLPDGRVERYRP